MVNAEQIVILTKEEEYLVRHFQLDGVVNLASIESYSSKPSSHFLCLEDIFYFLEHSPLDLVEVVS